ncbi:hypothetical protein LTR35_012453 [Friedmanniomyces endolithicus]|uniref:Uncharacterized protein n=1 Tax=Friedmanniomyces endolithicus TaxID=329885 RepID=A0AAN6FX01_9PEZI|nr:hypothetical protein LTR35_012453 [Friedmanniomyces endolithicus]KAK0294605.1 hypothetical protein LTS00_006806 [Friedmanniomyces endolithicus]KAK0326011.1 hypothetical protein LTR82_002756 [Friedmanniomyces endolithicus]KAK1009788.1 hypothetical protein LTR54_005584 [Friedmanniomyces endolithicus]
MAATAMKNLTAILAAAGSPLPPGYDSYPVEHFGVSPAPTTCFNEGPGQAHPWMRILAKTFCNHINNWEFDYLRYNTATGYWSAAPSFQTRDGRRLTTDLRSRSRITAGDGYDDPLLAAMGGWYAEYPTAALLQVGLTPGRTDALTLKKADCLAAFSVIIDGCNTAGLDGKQGGQLMLGNGAYWGTDELYYTFDPNYQGQPTNQYFIDIGPNDSSFDITDAGMYMAEYGCGSSC